MRRLQLVALCALLAFAGRSSAAIDIQRISKEAILFDSSHGLTGMYVAFAITNNDPVTYPDVWVTLNTAGSIYVQLAPFEDGVYRIGSLAPGETKPAYLYLEVLAQSFGAEFLDVDVREGSPVNPPLTMASFEYPIVDTLIATPERVTSISHEPAEPHVGDTVRLTVTGETGQLGIPLELAFSPASHPDWPADVIELTDVTTSVYSQADDCTSLVQMVEQDLLMLLPDEGPFCYIAEYTFRIVEPTFNPTTVSPIHYLHSGAQIKHVDLDCFILDCELPEFPWYPPQLLGPADNLRIADATPTFRFKHCVLDPGCDDRELDIELEWDEDPEFPAPWQQRSDIDPGFENLDDPGDVAPFRRSDELGFTPPLVPDETTLWWRVRVKEPAGSAWSPWSEARSLTRDSSNAPAHPLGDWFQTTDEQLQQGAGLNTTVVGGAIVLLDELAPGSYRTPDIELTQLTLDPTSPPTVWEYAGVTAEITVPSAGVTVEVFRTADDVLAGSATSGGALGLVELGVDLSGMSDSSIYMVVTLSPGISPRVESIVARVLDPATDVPPAVRNGSMLGQNHPNPFNPRTVIPFRLENEGWVRLAVYDLAGRRVRTLVDEVRPAGEGSVLWSGVDDAGRGVASGVYLYRLEMGSEVLVRRLVLVR